MTDEEIRARYFRHARFMDGLWKELSTLELPSPEYFALHERICAASSFLCWLFDRLPETKAERALLGPPPTVSEAAVRRLIRGSLGIANVGGNSPESLCAEPPGSPEDGDAARPIPWW
jgi:hypothetical protein